MKHTKNNLLEIVKDVKGIACCTVSLVVDTVKVPVSICKDMRDGILKLKAKEAKPEEGGEVELVETKEKKDTEAKPELKEQEA